MSRYWLLKTEPSEFSFADLQRAGRAVWDGVTNPLALKHLRAMQPGDLVLIYHTGDQKQIVGMAEVVRGPYPDPKVGNPKWVVVDVAPREPLPKPVRLAAIKGQPKFADFELVRMPRLSVMPVSVARWRALLALAR